MLNNWISPTFYRHRQPAFTFIIVLQETDYCSIWIFFSLFFKLILCTCTNKNNNWCLRCLCLFSFRFQFLWLHFMHFVLFTGHFVIYVLILWLIIQLNSFWNWLPLPGLPTRHNRIKKPNWYCVAGCMLLFTGICSQDN